MSYNFIPISYSKINPSGQLIIGLQDGTVLNAGNVIGPTGLDGPTGPTGPIGNTGPMGPVISNLQTTSDGRLYYTVNNKTYVAGKLPIATGPTGSRGNSIINVHIDDDNVLSIKTDDNKVFKAGKITVPIGPTGERGYMGHTGMPGKPFNIYDIKIEPTTNQLVIRDTDFNAYTCGYVGVTGPTGPVMMWSSAYIDQRGHLLLLYNNNYNYLDAGYIVGNTGPIGPTGNKGDTCFITNCILKDQQFVFTDNHDRVIHCEGEKIIGTTGPLGNTGPTGPKGDKGDKGPIGKINSIRQVYVNEYGQLILTDCQNQKFTSTGHSVIGNTGTVGPTGCMGPTGPIGIQGPTGKTTYIKDVFIDSNGYMKLLTSDALLFEVGDVYGPTGFTGCTGPTGPMSTITDLYIDENSHLIMSTTNQKNIDVGYVRGHTGNTGPTGGIPIITRIDITDENKLEFTVNNKMYSTSTSLYIPTGPTGKKGPRGEATFIKNISIDNDQSMTITDSKGNIHIASGYLRGHTGHIGPTGHVTWFKSIKLYDNGMLRFTDCLGNEYFPGFIYPTTGPTGTMCGLSDIKVSSNGRLVFTDTNGEIQTTKRSLFGPTGSTGTTGATGNTGSTGPIGIGIKTISSSGSNVIVTLDNDNKHIIPGCTGPVGHIGPTGLDGISITNVELKHTDQLWISLSDKRDIYVGDLPSITGPTGTVLPYKGTGIFGQDSIFDNVNTPNEKSYSVIIDTMRKPHSYYPTHFGLGLHVDLYSTPDYSSIVIGNHIHEIGGPNNESDSISIGNYSGQYNQSKYSIAIGTRSGFKNQSMNCISIGNDAGYSNQEMYSVAIGYKSGYTSCKEYSNCIGFRTNAAHPNVNVINATTVPLTSLQSNSTFLRPVRLVDNIYGLKQLYYDEITGEIVYN